MKNLIFIICIFYSLNCISQGTIDDEYEIYGELVGNHFANFYLIYFGIPTEYKLEIIEDSIYNIIWGLPVKQLDQKKIYDIALKKRLGQTYQNIYIDLTMQLYFSPIYFKSEDEAYFMCIGKRFDKVLKPLRLFLEAKKLNGKWVLKDYYMFF